MSSAFFMRRLASLQGDVPTVDGMGYVTSHVQGGPGFSYTRHSKKQMPNGVLVFLTEWFPSPLDRESKMWAKYEVWLGQTDHGEYGPCPFPVPKLAQAQSWAPDAEVDWFANFGENSEAAKKYASSLPELTPA
jgi:hypothetical protein